MGANTSCCGCISAVEKSKNSTHNVDTDNYRLETVSEILKKHKTMAFTNIKYDKILKKKTINDMRKDFTIHEVKQELNEGTTDIDNHIIDNLIEDKKFLLDKNLAIENKNLIINILKQERYIRKSMSLEVITDIIYSFYGIKITSADVVIYTAGEDAENLFILISGKLKIIDQDNNVNIIENNTIFGHSALGNSIREETVISLQPCEIVCISGEHYKAAVEKCTSDEEYKALNRVNFFKHINSEKQYNIIDILSLKKYSNKILYEGEEVKKIYIIVEGKILCQRDNKTIKILSQDDIYGELYYLSENIGCNSYYTLVPDEYVIVNEVLFKKLDVCLGSEYKNQIIYSIFQKALRKSEKIMSYLVDDNISNIFDLLEMKIYREPNCIYNEKKVSNKILIILSGRILKGKEIVGREECFYGERYLENTEIVEDNIIPEGECLVLEANWFKIMKSLKSLSNNDLTIYEKVNKLKKIPLFVNLSEIKLFQLARTLSTISFTDDEEIINEAIEGERFFILNKGKAKVSKNNLFIRDIEPYTCFGEMCFAKDLEVRSATIKANGNVECYSLTYNKFKEILDENLTRHIQKIISLQDYTITLQNLYYLRDLRNFKYGKLSLVHNEKNLYSIKSFRIKEVCLKSENLIREKNVMKQIDNPFMIKLVKTLKDDSFIFFLLEYIEGLSLRKYIEKRKPKELRNEFESSFYGAIMYTAANYLHRKKILHRNIIPENIMITQNGYLKLIEFDLCKNLGNENRTNTLLGTPHYLAPEMLTGKGYSFSVDLWSIGVVIFELFYGLFPFGANLNNVMDIYKSIVEKNMMNLPNEPKLAEVNSFFKMIFNKNLNQRLINYNHIKIHPFFKNIQYENLIELKIKPSYIPDIENSNNLNSVSKKNQLYIDYLNQTCSFAEYDHSDEISKKEKLLLNEF